MFTPILKNEITKISRLPMSLLLLTPLIIPSLAVFVFVYVMPYEEFVQRISNTNNDPNPYHYVVKWFTLIFNFMLIPYYAIVLIWYHEIEKRGRGWKFLKSMPLNFKSLLFSKIIVAVGYVGIAGMISAISLFITVVILQNAKPTWPFGEYEFMSINSFVTAFGSIYLVSIPALVLVFIAVMLLESRALIILFACFVGYLGFQFNPFHFHMQASEMLRTAQAGEYINFLFFAVVTIFASTVLLGIHFGSTKIFRHIK